ncbi:MAG: amidase domain-containing protein [Oscillospiraceae bacterium]|nr:amidase domain-containing protein [Oscillospiraceae bacterium]MDD3833657.1 amidase domain-containing protein [Oscillospiraceae bacterium]
MPYDRLTAVAYAHKWAFKRNPAYGDFSEMGGDCTNFISQCILAGGASMNYIPNTGWYYRSMNNRAPSWTGVEFLYRFLITNKGKGPYAVTAPASDMRPGDVVQLSFNGGRNFGHSLFVVETVYPPQNSNIMIATHSYDSDYRPLDSWENVIYRYIHISGTR